MGHFNKCCCCNLGSVIPRWENVSKVRPAGDTLGPNYTADPFPRTDPSACGTTPHDVGSPAGSCGYWLQGGDLNGVSAQEIDATVDDIMPCSADDSTHVKKDHNCYVKSGSDTVDMRVSKLFGFFPVFAKKQWHGRFGFTSNHACGDDPSGSPDQIKYRKIKVTATASQDISLREIVTLDSDSSVISDATYDFSGSMDMLSWNEVGRLTGIITGKLSKTSSLGFTVTNNLTSVVDTETTGLLLFDYHSRTPIGVDVIDCMENWSVSCPDLFNFNGTALSSTDLAAVFTDYNGTAPWFTPYKCNASVDILTMTNTLLELEVTLTPNGFTFDDGFTTTVVSSVGSGTNQSKFHFKVELSEAYSAQDVLDDANSAFAEWDMSDIELAHLRQDETLALAPLVCYDENSGSIVDKFLSSDSTDFSFPESGGMRPTTDYIDMATHIWRIDTGTNSGAYSTDPSSLMSGTDTATLVTLYDGSIISHTQAGSDRHWWPGYPNLTRQFVSGLGYQWLSDTNGGYSDTILPPVTMRWLNGIESLYDATSYRGDAPVTPGVYPQEFGIQYSGKLIIGKYIQATQTWPAANFGRPCGPDKYAVDQPTVCSIVSGSAPSFVVKKTGNANDPLATGGLAVSDYILHEVDGIYQISGITDNMDGTFTVAVGSLIDSLPTGYTSILHEVSADSAEDGTVHLGTLRFPSYPGICGRVAITASWASGTLTITSATALPYLRDIIGAGISVDLYDTAMTSGTKIAAAALTRVDDTHWTTPLVSAPAITVAYMTGASVDYTKYKTTSQRTGVKFAWTFDNRSAQLATGSQPDWYGGSGSGTGTGVVGCTACAIDQFNYNLGGCKAIVGIVPFYGETPAPVESFANQELFASADTITADDIYGGHWQSELRLTMPDPFWQAPYKPDGDGSSFTWTEDDGSGLADAGDGSVKYYAHRPLVEALATLPSGCTLPSNVNGGNLIYDSAHNTISPPYYVVGSGGYPIADNSGSYGSYETDWGFATRVKANAGGRFSSQYAYVNTGDVP